MPLPLDCLMLMTIPWGHEMGDWGAQEWAWFILLAVDRLSEALPKIRTQERTGEAGIGEAACMPQPWKANSRWCVQFQPLEPRRKLLLREVSLCWKLTLNGSDWDTLLSMHGTYVLICCRLFLRNEVSLQVQACDQH